MHTDEKLKEDLRKYTDTTEKIKISKEKIKEAIKKASDYEKNAINVGNSFINEDIEEEEEKT